MKSTKKASTERQTERNARIRKTIRGLVFPVIMLGLVASAVYVIMKEIEQAL